MVSLVLIKRKKGKNRLTHNVQDRLIKNIEYLPSRREVAREKAGYGAISDKNSWK